jgi:hypothetical protein
MRSRESYIVGLIVLLQACSGKSRPFGEGVAGGGASDASDPNATDQVGSVGGPSDGSLDERLGAGPNQEGSPPVGSVEPTGSLVGPASTSCIADAGACSSIADAGVAVCRPTGPRDCTSELDNDCDGQPDNTVDSVCACTPGSIEPCDEHPGLDGRGQCRPGSRICLLDDTNLTSSWGACEGSVGPGEQDSCAVAGDDTNCDGTNNGGCPCVPGETRPCGPDTDEGICQQGTQTCLNGTFGQCEGAVFPAPRDCSSTRDSDCDGRPDNTVDNVCTCAIGSIRACGTHPGRDGNGQCQAGSQSCEGRSNNATSGFGTCAGSVGPSPQDSCASGNDANCNGVPNEGCACINGETRACGPDTELGLCQRGTQTCSNGAFGACQGAVFPTPRNCSSQQDNDCDGRADNTIDNVCTCAIGSTQTCDTHPGQDGIGQCRAGQRRCEAGGNNSTSTFGACTGSVGPAPRDSCATVGNDATCDGIANGGCNCGSMVTNGTEVCREVRRSLDVHGSNLGGIAGADSICSGDFGAGWKALLVGTSRRASVTPFLGDGQLDWVLRSNTYYFNEREQLVWQTDASALLGVRAGRQQSLLAPLFDTTPLNGGGSYPWSGYRPDWTTITQSTCSSWTSIDLAQSGAFIVETLTGTATERCDDDPYLFILCVQP